MKKTEEIKEEVKGTFINTLIWSIIRITEIVMER